MWIIRERENADASENESLFKNCLCNNRYLEAGYAELQCNGGGGGVTEYSKP